MNNIEIKAELKAAKIPYWQIADMLGCHENTIIRKMRKELSEADRKLFIEAIEAIKRKKG